MKSNSASGQLADEATTSHEDGKKSAKEKSIVSAFLNVDKARGISSHDVVNHVRRLTGIKQVGHAGTLDPMATGVMIVALGKACRLLRFLADDKCYLATITLGMVTDTDDIEGKILETNAEATNNPPSLETVSAALNQFVGDLDQIPPYYSAIHVDGKRLYEMARAGMAPPEIKARPVTIHALELISYEPPLLKIRVDCSKGTYIRSIARDLGAKLGLGGTLSGLVRERCGAFVLAQAVDLQTLAPGALPPANLVSIEKAVNLPVLTVNETIVKRLIMGQKIGEADLNGACANLKNDSFALVINAVSGKPFCIGRFKRIEKAKEGEGEGEGEGEAETEGYLAPEVVFADV